MTDPTPSRSDARRLLGVGPGATRDEVEAAFRRQVSRAHPDRGGDGDAFRLLVAARLVLVDGPPPTSAPGIVVRRHPWWRRTVGAVAKRRRPGPPRVQ
ncbi:hypothetical protein BH18ACT4_BH18ACT4_12340 [soil metagenome]